MTSKEILNKTFELIYNYQSAVASGEDNVLNYHQPGELDEKIDLKGSFKSGNYSKLFSDIEKELLKKMCRIAGFSNGGGTFITGGSNANMLAMMSARNKLLPEVKQKGVMGVQELTAFVSDQSHYSFDTAANILGIGSNHVYKIKSGSYGRMLIEDLVKAIETSLKKGETPFFIAATASTALLGAFDPLDEIAEIAKNYKIWMHVDGSFGGSIILSTKYPKVKYNRKDKFN